MIGYLELNKLLLIIIFLSACFLTSNANASIHWRELQKGLEYASLTPFPIHPQGKIHAFRFSAKHYQLRIALANQLQKNTALVKQLADHYQAPLGINGGFFDEDQQMLGLRISENKLLSLPKPISWWGIFYIQGKRARIISAKHYQSSKNLDFAIQSGPRLIIDDRIPDLKPGNAERSALGITKQGKIILLATEQLPLSTTQLAHIMHRPGKDNGFDCQHALNLDGGSSTQLYANFDSLQLDISGFTGVSDSVLLFPRHSAVPPTVKASTFKLG